MPLVGKDVDEKHIYAAFRKGSRDDELVASFLSCADLPETPLADQEDAASTCHVQYFDAAGLKVCTLPLTF